MDQRSVEIAGQQIAYLESPTRQGGQADRPVIFVHGNSSSARTWLPVMSGDFGQRFRCLALDLPGHGKSQPAKVPADYSVPGHAGVLTSFARALGADDAVVVGWSMGGQVALEAAPMLPKAGGFVIFGAPPVASPADMGEAFVPNPSAGALFSAQASESEARLAMGCLTAPGSTLDIEGLVSDYLSADGTARTGLASSVGEGRFADEVAIVAGLGQPLAIVHGAGEQLVSLDYLRKLDIPALWRGEVQVIPGAGHALHLEKPQQLAALLTDFIGDLDG